MLSYYNPFRNSGEYQIQEPSVNQSQNDQPNRDQQILNRFEALKLKYFAVREVPSLNFLKSWYSLFNYAFLMVHLLFLIRAYTEGQSISDSVLIISSMLNLTVMYIRVFQFYVGLKYIEEKTLLLILDVITSAILFAFYYWGISLMHNKIEVIHHSYVKFYNTTLDDKSFYNATFHDFKFHNASFYDYRKFYYASIKEQLKLLIYNEVFGSEALVSILFLNAIISILYVLIACARLKFQTRRENQAILVEPASQVGSGSPVFILHPGPRPSAKIKKPSILGYTSSCSTISEHTERCSTQDSITHSTIGYVESEFSSGVSSYTHDTKGETLPIGNYLSKDKGKSTKSSAKNPGSSLIILFPPTYESDQTSTKTSITDNTKFTRFKVKKIPIDNKEEEVKANVQEFIKKNENERSLNEEGKNCQDSVKKPSNIIETEAGPSGLQLSNKVKCNIKDEAYCSDMTEKTNEKKTS